MLARPLALLGAGPVGVFAAASAEARRTAAEHVALLARHGVHGGRPRRHHRHRRLRRSTNHDLLEGIAGLRGILLCGGNQIRLVETLLHRGEESAVLRAIARAHARGAVLVAASGAASALSGVMIAGGSSWEALRYGVSSDTGHRGLVIQEGIGLFGGGIVDQNLIGGNRLGRLVVACAEESERFGIGVFEDSAVIASHAGTRLEAAGSHGFVLVEIDPTALVLQSDSFVARGVRLTVLGPGDTRRPRLRRGRARRPARVAAALLARLIDGLAQEAGKPRRQPPRPADAHPPRRRRRGPPRPRIPPRRERLSRSAMHAHTLSRLLLTQAVPIEHGRGTRGAPSGCHPGRVGRLSITQCDRIVTTVIASAHGMRRTVTFAPRD